MLRLFRRIERALFEIKACRADLAFLNENEATFSHWGTREDAIKLASSPPEHQPSPERQRDGRHS